jgi:hypothetical protein
VCQKVPQMPAGGARGSELELGTFTHKAPCQVRVAPTRGVWTETAVSGVLFLTANAWGLGYKKCLIETMGSKSMGPESP